VRYSVHCNKPFIHIKYARHNKKTIMASFFFCHDAIEYAKKKSKEWLDKYFLIYENHKLINIYHNGVKVR
jgi:hypothetical protein